MKQNLKDFLVNLVISMFIGLFVAIIEVIIVNINNEIVEILIMSSIIGGVIGTISKLIFIYIVEINQKSAIVAFISTFVVIGVVSSIPSLYDYFIDNSSTLTTTLLEVLITAEILGMSFCYYSYRRYLAFNSKLISKKRELIKNK
jgi:hypothetical protein